MHQHISCGAPIFFIGEIMWGSTRSNSEYSDFLRVGILGSTRSNSEQLGALGALGATRSNSEHSEHSDYCLNSLTSSTS